MEGDICNNNKRIKRSVVSSLRHFATFRLSLNAAEIYCNIWRILKNGWQEKCISLYPADFTSTIL